MSRPSRPSVIDDVISSTDRGIDRSSRRPVAAESDGGAHRGRDAPNPLTHVQSSSSSSSSSNSSSSNSSSSLGGTDNRSLDIITMRSRPRRPATRQSIDDCRMIVNACAHQELISIICSCNRSSPHLELIRLILLVLMNLDTLLCYQDWRLKDQ